MKKVLLALTAIGLSASVFAQGTDGQFNFKTATIQRADGSGTYNTPLFENNRNNLQGGAYIGNGDSAVAAGPSGITVGLFLAGSNTPFVTGQLGTAGGGAAFVATPSPAQTVTVPGQPIGSTPQIIIRAWTTSVGSFAAAQSTIDAQWGEWSITSRPLGGTPSSGTPITPPTLTGWGAETGTGFELNRTVPEPSTIALGVLGIGALALARRRK